MTTDRFEIIAALFDRARRLSPDDREALLRESCAHDATLRSELDVLLAHHDAAESSTRDELLDAASSLLAELGSDDDSAASATADPLPESVGRYRILGEIARGGFGIVLRGEDARIGRDVAVKVLPRRGAADPWLAELLRAEGRTCGRLEHPAIVPVYELGETEGGGPFVAMKVVEGQTLATLLRARARLDADRARFLGIFEQVCQAVAYAHTRGVLHRDLKPQNLMIGAFGEVQVMDWGLAEIVATRRSDSGENVPAIGTPAYMAPEQARGEPAALDPRCDVFGLGAILCEILTGQPPFTGRGTRTVIEQARAGDLADAAARLAGCGADPEIAALAQRCLAPDPAERPQDARDVAERIRGYLDSLDERKRAAELEAASARARADAERKARRLTSVLGALVVLVTLGGTATWIALDRAAVERQRVASERLRSAMLDAERVAADAEAVSPETAPRWQAAAAAARTAARLAVAEADAALRAGLDARLARIEARLRDVRFVERLEAIALENRFLSGFDRRAELAAYAAAFTQRVGVPQALPVEDARAALADFAYPDRLLRALDLWALSEYQVDRRSPRMRWIRELANGLDDEPFRAEVRTAAAAADFRRLEGLAASERAGQASAGALLSLGLELVIAGLGNSALRVLELAHSRYPGDFEVNINLAIVHLERRDYQAALRYVTAATALRPAAALPHAYAATTLSGLARHDEAAQSARTAVALAPDQFGPCVLAAEALRDAGFVEEAVGVAERVVARTPPNHAVYPSLASMLAGIRLTQGRPEQALEWYRREVSSPRVQTTSPSWAGKDAAAVRTLRPLVEAAVDAAGASEPVDLYLLARLDERDGRWRDALQLYERIEALRPDFALTRWHIARLRRGLGRELTTHAAVDEAIGALDAALPYAEARRRVLGDTAELGDDPNGIRAYADGCLLLRAGRPGDAIAPLERALAADREAGAAWVALHRAIAARDGRTRADARLRALLAEGPAPAIPIPIPPAPPEPVAPEPGARVAPPVAFEVTGFEVVDPRLELGWTRWQIRALDSDYERRPALDLGTAGALELVIPPGLLESDRAYAWRAACLTGGTQLASDWSPEREFRTAPADVRPVPIELSGLLDVDVVADPGDETGDAFDPPNHFQLVVEGFDGTRTDAPDVAGLPRDRRIGVHRLAPYDGPNSIRIEASDPPLRIALPARRYVSLLVLVAGANGQSRLHAGVVYEDGTVDQAAIKVADWFSTSIPGSNDLGQAMPVWRRMDRMERGRIEQRDAALVLQAYLACDPTKRAAALVIDPQQSQFDGETTAAHVLAVTGMASGGGR